MADEKPKTVKLSHSNGTTVVVAADRAESLVAGGNFSKFSAGAKQAARDARRSQVKPSA